MATIENHIIVSGIAPDEKPIISVVALMQYAVSPSGKCTSVKDEIKLQTEFEHYDGIQYKGYYQPSILKRDVDIYSWRNFTDLVIQGTLRTSKPQKSMNLQLMCAGNAFNIKYQISVTGDRFVEKGLKGLRLTEPEPFTEMPIRYDKAYGGTDELAESKFADPEDLKLLREVVGEEEDKESSEYSYPRNPAGKGYLIVPEGAEGLAFPNLEFPQEQLSLSKLTASLQEWGNRPYPACFDWFSHAWFPRSAFVGDFPETPDGKVPQPELKLGILPNNLSELSMFEIPKHGFAQGAHPFLCRNRFLGNEKIHITGMSKDGKDFIVELPGRRPEIQMALFSTQMQKTEPILDLVFIETEKDLVTLLWRGTLPIPQGKEYLMPDWEEKCPYRIKW